ncbi:CRISPR-associated endonuclease Cas1 [Methanolobus sp.]|uniref:CRISPR-associated endonuclease Cas1 n=1 Tax=Methanolobus sp. TaxID=1874737 RepID=UPI0025EA3785|nr:CRISPR-associated endonuclease Cas1 [Methanolobus sp.]
MGAKMELHGNDGMTYKSNAPEDDFCLRSEQYQRATGAGNQVNAMLNPGYALLETECLRAINTVSLDSNVGFLH